MDGALFTIFFPTHSVWLVIARNAFIQSQCTSPTPRLVGESARCAGTVGMVEPGEGTGAVFAAPPAAGTRSSNRSTGSLPRRMCRGTHSARVPRRCCLPYPGIFRPMTDSWTPCSKASSRSSGIPGPGPPMAPVGIERRIRERCGRAGFLPTFRFMPATPAEIFVSPGSPHAFSTWCSWPCWRNRLTRPCAPGAVAAVEAQLVSWVEANPFLTGIHYISPTECALRLLAVCHAVDALRPLVPALRRCGLRC
jgi:hypothetical protein